MNDLFARLNDTPWAKVWIAGLLVGFVYYLAIFDDGARLKDVIDQNKQSLLEAETQLKATRESVENANRFEAEVNRIAEQFARITDFMPDRMGVAELTNVITDNATKSGAKLMRTEPEKRQEARSDKADFFETTRVGFHLEGSFSQMVTFLSLISQENRLLTFDEVELSSIDSAPPDAPVLDFKGQIIGYRYIAKKPAAEQEKGGGSDNP
jgi:Tfp pilus assembly protein PilO